MLDTVSSYLLVLIKHPVRTSLAIFLLLLSYFLLTYSYYPGMSVQFQGEVDSDVSGRLYWDYGSGFTELDYIDVELTAGKSEALQQLGSITVEPLGFHNEQARDDLVWLVLSEADYEAGKYTISGKHKWMHWISIKPGKKGRQLALFPGSSISLATAGAVGNIKIFKTPDSGFAKVTTESGITRFIDCYGKNPQWRVTRYEIRPERTGEIAIIRDGYRKRDATRQPLPNNRIYRLKLEPDPATAIAGIVPYRLLSFGVKRASAAADSNPLSAISRIEVNGVDLTAKIENTSPDELADLYGIELSYVHDKVQLRGEIYSSVIELSGDYTAEQVSGEDARGHSFTQGLQLENAGKTVVGRALVDSNVLTVNKIVLTDAANTEHVYTGSQISGQDGTVIVANLTGAKQTSRSFLLIVVQLVTAALTATIVYWVLRLPLLRAIDFREEVLPTLFARQQIWFFWLVLVLGIAVNVLWLLAEWPGCLTPDSVHVHTELKQLKITNHHPYIYSLFVLGLYNFYDAPLSVIVFQIVSYYTLIAAMLYYVVRRGVRWWLALPLYVLSFLAIPVNLFNITVWKDIPYTTLVLFWAFFLTACFFAKCYGQNRVRLRFIDTFLLSLLFLAVCSFRHNGIVYAAFIPVALLVFSRITWSSCLKFFALSGLLFILFYQVLPPHILYQKPSKNNFSKVIVDRTINKAAKVGEGVSRDEGYYLEHYLAERVRRFTASLGTSPKATTWYNDMVSPPQRWFAVDNLKSKWIVEPKSAYLAKVKNKLLETRSYTGMSSGRFIHWNSLFGLTALLIVFFLYKFLPLSAFYSSFFLFQAAGMFFVVWPRWRYLYFLYLGGLYLVFFIVLEINVRRSRRKGQLPESYL